MCLEMSHYYGTYMVFRMSTLVLTSYLRRCWENCQHLHFPTNFDFNQLCLVSLYSIYMLIHTQIHMLLMCGLLTDPTVWCLIYLAFPIHIFRGKVWFPCTSLHRASITNCHNTVGSASIPAKRLNERVTHFAWMWFLHLLPPNKT